jgi:hypothetical protein
MRVAFILQTAPGLADADLPLATGARPPQLWGDAQVTVGIRDLARLLAFLRVADPERFRNVDRLQGDLPGPVRVDVDGLVRGLTGNATITSDDMRRLTVRTKPRDPRAWRGPLERLTLLSGLLQQLGIDDVELDEEPGETYRLTVDGRLVLRAGLYGATLVATSDPGANLRSVASASLAPSPPGAAGALSLRMRARTVRAELRRRLELPPAAGPVLARLGDLTGWARAELDALRGELRLAVR